jgi:site-specific DNA-cytosine methylase
MTSRLISSSAARPAKASRSLGSVRDWMIRAAISHSPIAQFLIATPKWFLWENVPGVLSTDGGRAFGSILGAMAELGYGFAYRVLDAQYVRVDGFGRAVPQRRRRVFVVGHLGNWRRAAKYYLSAKACSGILRRAAKRGKELPAQLARALRAVAGSAPTLTATADDRQFAARAAQRPARFQQGNVCLRCSRADDAGRRQQDRRRPTARHRRGHARKPSRPFPARRRVRRQRGRHRSRHAVGAHCIRLQSLGTKRVRRW